MARIREDQRLLPSLLDRLLDDEPTNTRETPKSRSQVLQELKQSVRRDLENLLNTRWACEQWPPQLDQIETSLASYGIPDFSGINMSTPASRENLRQTVETAIQQYEPRLQRVKVVLQENADPSDRTLRLRIDGQLYAEPAPEPVVFDSQLQPLTSSFNVQDDTR